MGDDGLTFVYQPATAKSREHHWSVVGPDGGIHIHGARSEFFGGRWSGGVEMHRRAPGEYEGQEPSHTECWLLKAPCWHDGTSLYFSERIAPMLDDAIEPFSASVHEFMHAELRHWYRRIGEDARRRTGDSR